MKKETIHPEQQEKWNDEKGITWHVKQKKKKIDSVHTCTNAIQTSHFGSHYINVDFGLLLLLHFGCYAAFNFILIFYKF